MTNFDQFIAAVRTQMQPTPRANATANTLEQICAYLPEGVTLEDLAYGWAELSNPPDGLDPEGTPPQVAPRRATCGELAKIARQLVPWTLQNREHTVAAWQAWVDAFAGRDDPRQAAMGKTFERELSELR